MNRFGCKGYNTIIKRFRNVFSAFIDTGVNDHFRRNMQSLTDCQFSGTAYFQMIHQFDHSRNQKRIGFDGITEMILSFRDSSHFIDSVCQCLNIKDKGRCSVLISYRLYFIQFNHFMPPISFSLFLSILPFLVIGISSTWIILLGIINGGTFSFKASCRSFLSMVPT